jgi:hypothetical protein
MNLKYITADLPERGSVVEIADFKCVFMTVKLKRFRLCGSIAAPADVSKVRKNIPAFS